MEEHTCVITERGYCEEVDRDWCERCHQCTVWDHETCTKCGAVWGEGN